MIWTLRKPLAFLVRDFIDDTSYKLAFVLHFTNVIFLMLVFYYLAQLISGAAIPQLEFYGGDYFSFALIGIAFTRIFSTTLNKIRGYVREAQLNGTFEVLLSTQTGALMTVFSSMLYSFLFTCMEVVIIFVLGALLLDFNIYWSNIPLALLILVPGLISFSSLGIISSGFIILFKRGDPVARLLTLAAQLLSGEVYPVSVLPLTLQYLAWVVPNTHILEGIRLALLKNYSFEQLIPNLVALLILDAVLVPASIIWFHIAIKRAKAEGNLSYY